MVEYVLSLFESVFWQCAEWTSILLNAVGGKGVVLAAFVIVILIGMLIIPMRGGSLVTAFGTFYDFNQGMIHKGKHGTGKTVRSGYRSSYHGRYEKGNKSAQTKHKMRDPR